MENSKYQIFKQLHYDEEPFLLANVWDAKSAENFQKSGYKAVGTSSGAVAAMLGYEDGEKITFDDLLFIVEKICNKVDLPVSVDIEGGYARNITEICANIERLHQLGVVGINIEDSTVETTKTLLKPAEFARTVAQIKSFLINNRVDVFLNVRTDPYLLGIENPFEQTLERIENYENAGADGIFIPCLTNLDEMRSLSRKTSLPINVMCMPDLPSFDEIKEAGVKRISMGGFMFEFLSRQEFLMAAKIQAENSFESLFL